MEKIKEELKNKIDAMPYEDRDAIYRYLWAQKVHEDVISQIKQDPNLEGMTEEEYDQLTDKVIERYVYDCDYNCETDYWTNLDTLIDEEVKKFQKKKQEALKKQNFTIKYTVTGEFLVDVNADSLKEAEEAAEKVLAGACFGDLAEINTEVTEATDGTGETWYNQFGAWLKS